MRKFFLFSCVAIFSHSAYAQTTNPTPYCVATFDDAQGFPVDDHINSVVFGGLSSTSNAQYQAPHYVFYNNLAVKDFIKDSTYNLSLSFKVSGGCGYGVWIDYNRNNTFEANEKVAGTTGTEMLNLGNNTMVNKTVKIPSTAATGNTRMRVRIVEDDNHNMTNTSQLPCNASNSDEDVMDWGETEDYTINIKAKQTPSAINDANHTTAFTVAPNPGNGLFKISSESSFADVISVYNLMGKLILQVHPKSNQSTIDLSNQPKGIYILKLGSNSQEVTQKIIIQ
ncbi:MAG: T9SS type A sorting domain-containing protein [Bacteroidetes bacterium]|nr:T9SS type A sorting domain-containing protein [Bacteroidota bacterium]